MSAASVGGVEDFPTNTRAVVFMLALCTALSGCSVVGMLAGGGADAILQDDYVHHSVNRAAELEPRRNVCFERAGYLQRRTCGEYVGLSGPTSTDPAQYIVVDTGTTLEVVGLSAVRRLEVEESGRRWVYGGVIGATLDIALLVVWGSIGFGDQGPEACASCTAR